MTTAPAPKARKRMNWAPYLLILPSLLYLALFFGWPMVGEERSSEHLTIFRMFCLVHARGMYQAK